jgi:hypothetical protein
MADDNPIKRVPINQLRQEDGAHELAESADMEPYLRLIIAEMRNADPRAELEALRQLPLEKRYVWRIASSVKWGFADFDSVNVDAQEDFANLMWLLTQLQCCRAKTNTCFKGDSGSLMT